MQHDTIPHEDGICGDGKKSCRQWEEKTLAIIGQNVMMYGVISPSQKCSQLANCRVLLLSSTAKQQCSLGGVHCILYLFAFLEVALVLWPNQNRSSISLQKCLSIDKHLNLCAESWQLWKTTTLNLLSNSIDSDAANSNINSTLGYVLFLFTFYLIKLGQLNGEDLNLEKRNQNLLLNNGKTNIASPVTQKKHCQLLSWLRWYIAKCPKMTCEWAFAMNS